MNLEETTEVVEEEKKKGGGPGSRPVIDAKSRMLVSTLRDYFAKERDTLVPVYPPQDPIGRTACALKLSPETVKAIVDGNFIGHDQNSDTSSDDEDEEKLDEVIGFPDVDCFKMESIRQIIHSFMVNSEAVTRSKVKKAIKKNNLMPKSKSLSCVISHLGFYWKNCLKAKILLEREDYVSKRCKFLRTMAAVNLKNVIWIGETCLYLACINKVPYSSKRRGTMSKGGRVIMLHAGSYRGWVQGAKQIYISRKIHEFREDIGTKGFLEWFDSLLKCIPNQSIIVMEDNICHSEEINKPPKEHNTRDEILDWLNRHNVWLDNEGNDFSKAELLGLVAENRAFYPTYAADEAAAKCGHTVIRLPPEHSHFNPIERIFQQIQAAVEKRAESMGGLNLNDLEAQTQKAVTNITQKLWAEAVTQCGQFISKYWAQEPKLQAAVESLMQNIIQLKKNGRIYITKDGNFENHSISDNESESEYHSTHTKRIKISDPEPTQNKKILQKEVEIVQPNKTENINWPKIKTTRIFKLLIPTKENGITPVTTVRKQLTILPKPEIPSNLIIQLSGNTLNYKCIDGKAVFTKGVNTIAPKPNAINIVETIYDEVKSSKFEVSNSSKSTELNDTPIDISTEIPDIKPSEDIGLFQIDVASDDSLSDIE